MPVSGAAIGAAAIGGVLLWSAIEHQKITTTVRDILRGQQPQPGAETANLAPVSPVSPVTPVTPVGPGQAGNKALGRMLASAYGWGTGDEWAFLESGWQEESGWSTTAANVPSDPYNHAYGIPQANPGTKMASAGANWKTSAYTQIRWGLQYIKGRYGSPTQVPLWSANGPLPGYTGY